LRRSERARLRWWVLFQRGERTRLQVNGITRRVGSAGPITLRVEATRVTRSSVGVVREFIEVTLGVVRTPLGWRVDRAEGGGL